MDKTILELQSLHLRYFKSHKDLKINFKPDITIIEGDNETGKSSIFDGFMWLFFGKDSQNRADTKFSIKTIVPSTGEYIKRVEHSVEAVFLLNGERTSVMRVLKEKWSKKKGATQKVFTGNVTEYYWNDVPLTKRDYEAKINEFISESVFKMVTDPFAFNNLHWEKQRNLLTELGASVTDSDIAKGNSDFIRLMDKLTNKSFEEYKTQMKNQLKRLKNDKQGIPARIDELLRDKPEETDFNAVEKQIDKLNDELTSIDDKIADKNKASEQRHKEMESLREKLSDLKSKNQNIVFEEKQTAQEEVSKFKDPKVAIQSEIADVKLDIENYKNGVERISKTILTDKAELKSVIDKKKEKSVEWDRVNEEKLVFDDNDFTCPSCKRPLESDDVEAEKKKLKQDFANTKKKNIEQINKTGSSLADQQHILENLISKEQERVTAGKKNISKKESELKSLTEKLNQVTYVESDKPNVETLLTNALKNNKEYLNNFKEIDVIDSKLYNQQPVDVSEFTSERNELRVKLDELKSKMNAKAEIERINNRIKELELEEVNNAQLIADAEKELFTIQEFEIARMEAIEGSVNDKFKKVKFRMFSELIDGTKTPDCVCTYKGVPFTDVNTAGQIEAGLDIIDALCEFYNTQVVVFIDGAESITTIPDTISQQVHLSVVKDVKPLKVK